ncbi:MAG TPA: DNA-binding protein [Lachnospiraceae bacterium]|nr:DNA-binding protein [Lachnospiraceae bacterium]
MDKLYEQTLLYDFYGELLTEHQKKIFQEVIFDDCSLGEVAKEHGISRQGVHDMIKRSSLILEEYEEKLGLVRKFLDIKEKVNRIKELADDEQVRRLSEEILEEL